MEGVVERVVIDREDLMDSKVWVWDKILVISDYFRRKRCRRFEYVFII